jgi:methionine-rich copper-binding protein CopC
VLTFTVGDVTAPTVVSTVPADLASGVSTTAAITATFSEPMDAATITGATFFVRPTAGGANVPGAVTYNSANNTATFTPTGSLAGGTAYTATVTTGAKDLAGNPLAANKTWTFATADATPPTVTAVSPANDATNVATNATIQVTFSEAMDASTIIPANITLKNTGTSAAVTVTVAYNAATQVATITPTASLSNLTNYTLTVGTGVKDAAGNPMAAPFVSKFTTAPVPDIIRPTIVGRSPAPGATLVAANATVQVTFSEPIDQTTMNSTNFKLAPTATPGSPVTTAFSYNSATNTVTMTPSANLGSNVQYTVTVTTGVKDLAGNTLLAQDTWTFTTITDATAPTVLSTTPANNANTVAVNSTVNVLFSEDMDAATINGTTFTVKTTVGSTPVAGSVSYNAATRTAIFNPTGTLTANTGYTVTITSGAKDLAGNGLAGSFSFVFTTAP